MRSPKRDHAAQPQQAENLTKLFGPDAPNIVEGYIFDVLAGQRVYKVGVAGQVLTCRDLAIDAGMHPFGPLKIHTYQLGSQVLVLRIHGSRYSYIIGAIPMLVGSNKMNLTTPIAPFTGADAGNDLAHYYPLQMAFAGGVHDFNSGRPYDAIPGSDAGIINELGVGYGVSRLFAWLRSSDFSGIWCHYLDMLVRICAYNYELRHSGGEHWIRNDEGEIDEVSWLSPYPWEALGLLTPGGPVIEEADKGGWYTPGQDQNRFKLKEAKQTGIGRHLQFGGYLGDIHHEIIAVPEAGKVPAIETQDSQSNYTGVLSIQKHMDGTYALRSARQILFEKYTVIPVPKQIAIPEEAKSSGDSPDNYKAAGKTGQGLSHTKKVWAFSDEESPATWLCELQDYHSYMFNFYGFVPVVRHEKDWYLPEASESGIGTGTESAVYKPAPLGSKFALVPPKTVTLRIDHRTESAKYYLSRSFIDLMPDGSVVLGDGYGSTILMSQGHIFLNALGDVFLNPGRNLVSMAGSDVVMRAGKSVDISAAKRDVRIKAEKNLHMLAGNSGTGGLLLESRSKGDDYAFNNEVGEAVVSTGIIFKATDSQILGYARDIYLHTEEGGKLTLDAAGGKGDRVDIGRNIIRSGIQFTDTAGEDLESGEFTTDSVATNLFTKEMHILGAKQSMQIKAASLVLARTEGDVQVALDGNLSCGGSIQMEGSMQMGGSLAVFGDCIVKGTQVARNHANTSGYVGKLSEAPLQGEDAPKIRDDLEQIAVQIEEFITAELRNNLKPTQEIYYADEVAGVAPIGLAVFRQRIGFSFRKDAEYSVENMKLPEAPYQQTYRQQGTGVVYVEPEVKAPWGEVTLPYPGRKAWQEDSSFVTYDPSLFDPETGRAEDRAVEAYEAAKGDSGTKAIKLKGNYRVTKQE